VDVLPDTAIVLSVSHGGHSAAAPSPWGVVAVLVGLALMVVVPRRRHPVLGLAAVVALAESEAVLAPGAAPAVYFLAIMLVSYTAAARLVGWRVLVALVPVTVAVAVGQHSSPSQGYSEVAALFFLVPALVLLPALAGTLVRYRHGLTSRLQAAGERLALVREEQLALAVDQERADLAFEVQDALLAGLERLRLDAEATTLQSVVALEEAARAVLVQMRELLSGWRAVPQPLPPTVTALRDRVSALLATGSTEPQPSVAQPRGRFGASRAVLPSAGDLDVVAAVTAAVLAVCLVWQQVAVSGLGGPAWARALLVAAVAAPVAWLRRAPLVAAAVSGTALAVGCYVARPGELGSGLILVVPLWLTPLAVGTASARKPVLIGLAVCLAGLVPPNIDPDRTTVEVSALAGSWALALGCWVIGRVLRGQGRLMASVADSGAQLRQELQALARSRLEVERLQLAHELHDRIAHSMTIVVLQSAAARRVWTVDATRSAEHVAALRGAVRETLHDVHPLLVSLSGRAEPVVTPRLAALPALIDQARSAGMRVQLHLDGTPAMSIPADVDVAGYRVVQEALTNAARHAAGANVAVCVRYAGADLRISVVNGPPEDGLPGAVLTGAGHGLVGMRARVHDCDGEVEVGPDAGGGFTLTVRLPLRAMS
jgi:signal transduction histidine kinase